MNWWWIFRKRVQLFVFDRLLKAGRFEEKTYLGDGDFVIKRGWLWRGRHFYFDRTRG